MAETYRITATWDSRETKAVLAALAAKQWQFAEALALTKMAQSIKSAEHGEMRSVFDRPTPFTMNSLRLQPATRQRPEARVWFKDPPRLTESQHYLLPQVYGGDRLDKRFEKTLQRAGLLTKGMQLVPASGAKLDAYGNVSRGTYARMYADLQASPVGANTTPASRRRRGAHPRSQGFFYGNPGGRGRGVWERYRTAFGSAVKPVFLEARPGYRVRFDFFGLAERTAARVYPSAFDDAVRHTLSTAR